MYLVTVRCAARTGAAARITGALSEASINTRSMRFRTVRERYGWFKLFSRKVGEGEIVVKDEDWLMVSHQLEQLATSKKNLEDRRKNLELRVSKPRYQVTIEIKDEAGALNHELQKLATHEIDIWWYSSGDPRDNKALVRLVLDCPIAKYHLAKRLLKDCLQDESPYYARAVEELTSSDTLP